VERNESLPQALERELGEELDIHSVTSEEITRYEYTYPGKPPLRLIFFRVAEFEGEPRNLVFEAMEWVARQDLGKFDFLEGDVKFLAGVSSGLY